MAKLVKARYLDNLEFCQWLKAYFEKNYSGDEYDALGRRNNQELYYILGGGKVGAPPQKQVGAPVAKPAKPAAAASSAAASRIGSSAASASAMGGPKAIAGAGAGAAAAGGTGKVRELETSV